MERRKGFLHLREGGMNFFPLVAGFCFALLWLAIAPARGADFTASLDRDTITLGENATLSLTFEGGSPRNVPTPDVPGLQFVNAGNSQNFSILNGQMSSTVTVTFSVTPQRTGDFVIPPLTADINGEQLTSPTLRLKVLQPSAASAAQINSGSQIAFMKLVLPENKVYVGEIVTAELEIYLRDDVQNYGNLQFNDTPADGFVLGKNAEGGRYRTQIGNRVYTVIPIAIELTATKTGNLSLGPFTAGLVVVLPSQNQGGDSFFQQFFNQGQQKQISLTSEQINVQSLPLPEEGKPANFNGAVGDFSMNVTAGPTNVAVGDPITVRIQISGRGDLNSLTLPDQSAWHDFTIYPPTSKVVTTDPLGLQGTKTFEEIVAPQNTDVHELPPFSFSYFDPDTGDYRTLTEPSVELAVHSAGTTPVPTIAANKNSTSENQTPQDILPIKNDLGTLAQISAPLVTKPIFLAVQTLPVLAFLAALVWRRRTDSLANNPRLRRQRAVEKLIQNGLADLRKFAAENNSEEFFASLFRLLQEQLGERLDCPASAITENVVEENSILRGAPETARNDLRELFQLCNQARYAPVRGTSELNSVAAQFEKTVGELQNLKT